MTIDPHVREASRGRRLVELVYVEIHAVDRAAPSRSAGGALAGELALAIADCPARGEITQIV
jgi:hypothetical protein